MTVDTQTLFAIAVPVVGGLVWLIRLEGRLNMNEQRTKDLHDDLSEIKADVKTLLRMNGKRLTD